MWCHRSYCVWKCECACTILSHPRYFISTAKLGLNAMWSEDGSSERAWASLGTIERATVRNLLTQMVARHAEIKQALREFKKNSLDKDTAANAARVLVAIAEKEQPKPVTYVKKEPLALLEAVETGTASMRKYRGLQFISLANYFPNLAAQIILAQKSVKLAGMKFEFQWKIFPLNAITNAVRNACPTPKHEVEEPEVSCSLYTPAGLKAFEERVESLREKERRGKGGGKLEEQRVDLGTLLWLKAALDDPVLKIKGKAAVFISLAWVRQFDSKKPTVRFSMFWSEKVCRS